jgi:hypothetical protein
LPGYRSSGYGSYPARPWQPERIKLAVNLMLAGAAIKAIDGIMFAGAASSAVRGGTAIGSFIAVGLWIWMSTAIGGGAHWARVTGTVLFGVASLGLLVDLLILVDSSEAVAAAAIGFDFIDWCVGLCVVIIIWQKRNAAFFRPLVYNAGPPEGPSPY